MLRWTWMGVSIFALCQGCSQGATTTDAAMPVAQTPEPAPPPVPAPGPMPAPTQTPQSQLDVVYANGATESGALPLELDIYQSGAPCESLRPAVIMIHGGGFRSGSKNSSTWEWIASGVSIDDYVAIPINYRLEGDAPEISNDFKPVLDRFLTLAQLQTGTVTQTDELRIIAMTAAAEDALAALNWVVDNAPDHCIDPDKIGLWGSSAGAITALNVAYMLDDFAIEVPPVQVVIDYWGRLFETDVIERLDTPLFILHGDQDATVPYNAALDLADAAALAGVPLSFYTVAGAVHGFGAIDIETTLVDGLSLEEVTVRFLDAHLKDGTPVYETRTITP